MDSVESFSRAWAERFPQETAPDLQVFRKASPKTGRKNTDGCSLSLTAGVESIICQKQKRVKQLNEELAREQFVLEYLQVVLKERQVMKNGENEDNLSVPDDTDGKTKLTRGRPLVQNVEHWRSKSIEGERSDDDDGLSKSPEGNYWKKEKVPKPKQSASFSNRSYNVVSIPSRSASMSTAKNSQEVNRDAAVKQTASDAPVVPPKPRHTKMMQQLLESMGETSTDNKTSSEPPPPPPVKPRSRSHSREKLDEIKVNSPKTSPNVSPKSSPKSTPDRQGSKIGRDQSSHVSQQSERRGSQGLDDIPRARDLPSSLKRGSRGPSSNFKKGSKEDLDDRSRESSPKPFSERRGSQENLLESKPDPALSRAGKPRSDSAGTYQELTDMFERRAGYKKIDDTRPTSFTNRSYVEIDIDENRKTLEKLGKDKKDLHNFKVPIRPWERRHNYEEIKIFGEEKNTPGIKLQSTCSVASHASGAYDYEDIDEVLGKMQPPVQDEERGTSISKDEYYDQTELSSLSSDDDEDAYDNVLDVANDLIECSSSDDDDRIYYNLVHMKPPLIPMASDADEIKECIYADPRDILERKYEMKKLRVEGAVKYRISNSNFDRRMKKTIHQRLSIEVGPVSPDATQSGNLFLLSYTYM
jgi:hypothetical protein